MVSAFQGAELSGGFLGRSRRLSRPRPAGFHALYAALIVFFCFFYTSIVFNPEETADNLKQAMAASSRLSSRGKHRASISTTC